MVVPAFQTYYPSIEDMTHEQRAFYAQWVQSWESNKPVSVGGQISYLFCYLYTILERRPREVIDEVARLLATYPAECEPFPFYCRRTISDCHVFLGDFAQAMREFPELPVSGRASTQIDDLLSLKLHVGARIRGRDLIPLAGPQVTRWGREHLREIASLLDILTESYEVNERVNLLDRWSRDCRDGDYQLFTGTPRLTVAKVIRSYTFSRNPTVVDFAARLTRDAENTCRDEIGLPRVGEGWVSEVCLYYGIREAFPNLDVVHHARLKWLAKQHLDIYIPQLAIAIEYQGQQHGEPIAYFGGLESFLDTQRLDKKKARLCTRNGVRLIYVHPGFRLEDVVATIHEGNPASST